MVNAGSLLHDGKYSDFTIICRGERIPVDKPLLSLASPVLTAAFDLDMQEKRTGAILQNDFDVETVKRIISFAYAGDYSVSIDNEANPEASISTAPNFPQDVATTTPTPSNLRARALGSVEITGIATSELPIQLFEHVRVYGIAEYYAFAQLKTAAADRFIALFDKVWNLNKADALMTVIQEVLAALAARRDELRFGFAKSLASVDNFMQLGGNTSFHAELWRCEEAQGFTAELLQHAANLTGPRLRDLEHYNKVFSNNMVDMSITESNLGSIISMNAADHETELTAVKDKLSHVKSVMANLIIDLGNLPSECRSTGCSSSIGGFVFERAGHANKLEVVALGRRASPDMSMKPQGGER
ncbi:hypothetical protein LTR95_018240 [Oleoguttula sp. CCFEE 5521]